MNKQMAEEGEKKQNETGETVKLDKGSERGGGARQNMV